MNRDKKLTRRNFMVRLIGGASVLVLSGCEKLSESTWFPKVLELGEKATQRVQRRIVSRKAMAQEFKQSDLSPQFRSNGTSIPELPICTPSRSHGFKDYRLEIRGLVERPMSFGLAEIESVPQPHPDNEA